MAVEGAVRAGTAFVAVMTGRSAPKECKSWSRSLCSGMLVGSRTAGRTVRERLCGRHGMTVVVVVGSVGWDRALDDTSHCFGFWIISGEKPARDTEPVRLGANLTDLPLAR